MVPPLIFGPIPAFQNVPIMPQYYKPRRFVISGISIGQTTIVTTSVNQDYVIGQQVRLLIPYRYGSTLLNQQTGYVISIPSPNQVEVNIYSVGVDPFINAGLPTQAQILAIGDINTGAINNQGRVNNLTFIPGSFIDISPL
jgi:hypothetical protein